MITGAARSGFGFFCATSRSMYSLGRKSRPATSCRPSVDRAFSPTMYCDTKAVGRSCSRSREMLVLLELRRNGSWLTLATLVTPGIARSDARSSLVRAMALVCLPMPLTRTITSSFSASPLGWLIFSTRWVTRNRALQTMAQVRAISSTINAAAVLCRRRVLRMGRMSMGSPRSGAYCDLSWMAGVTCIARQAGRKPAAMLASRVRPSESSSMLPSRWASLA
ncbi:hypothetical protein D3C72_975600 [compost metagenome]